MKCPIRHASVIGAYDQTQYEDLDCLKEECAWWNSTNGMCAILQLSKSVYYAGLFLPLIEEKLPSHERLV